MILTVTLNPSVDRTVFLNSLKVGDTNRVLRAETDAGGKGINLARVSQELGAQALATGFLAGGPGAYIRSVLDREGVPHHFLEVAGETRLNVSIETEDGSPPTTLNEPGAAVNESSWQALIEDVAARLKDANWLALGGSLPPGAPENAYQILGELSKQAGVKLLLDADKEPFKLGIQAKPELIKPNTPEAERILGVKISNDQAAISACRKLREMVTSNGVALLSRGADGAVMATADGIWQGYSLKVVSKSTIGSGDSMLGAMLWAVETGKDWPEALRWGLAAGAATAETDGSEIGRRSEIVRLFDQAKVESIKP